MAFLATVLMIVTCNQIPLFLSLSVIVCQWLSNACTIYSHCTPLLLGSHTWLGTPNSWKKSSVGLCSLCFATTSTLPLLLVSWSASSGHYCPPDVLTPDLHCSTRQYTTRLESLFIISRNHCETPDQQTTQHPVLLCKQSC